VKKHIAFKALTIMLVAGCIFFAPDTGNAQNDDWSVSAANWMQYWYFKDAPSIYQDAKRDSLDNRFIVDFDLGDFYTGMWLNVLQIDRPDVSSEEMTQRYFGWHEGGFTIHAGNFYQVFDKGLVLNTFLDDVVYFDNNLDGIKVSGLYDRFEFDAFSARGLNSNFGTRDYILRGVRSAINLSEQFKFGLSYVRFKQNDPMEFSRAANANIFGINRRFIMGPVDLYIEYAQKRGRNLEFFPETNGDGTYASGSINFEKISFYSEYLNMVNLLYPNPLNAFNSPPSLSHSGRTLTSLAGVAGERGYQIGTLISPTFDINFDFSFSESFSRNAPENAYLAEKYSGVRWSLSSDIVVNYNWDRIDFSIEDEIENYLDIYYYLRQTTTLSLVAYTRRFMPSLGEDYHENYLTLGCGIANKFQINIGGSTSNWDTNPEEDPRKMAFVELTVRFPNHELVIFNGGERGGLICSSGICQNRPTFQGTRVVLFSRF